MDQVKLVRAFEEQQSALESLLQWSSEKQKQRAESWQQNVIDVCSRALTKCDQIMKEQDV